jgi:hypothetical protein
MNAPGPESGGPFLRLVGLVDAADEGLVALRQAAALVSPGGEIIGVVPLDVGLCPGTRAGARLSPSQ